MFINHGRAVLDGEPRELARQAGRVLVRVRPRATLPASLAARFQSEPGDGWLRAEAVDEAEAAELVAASQTAAVRVAGDTIGSGEAFREVIMTRGADMASGTLVMLKFTDRPKPRDQQVILGFVTADLEALKERIVANGGRLVGPTRDEPDHGVRVQFSEDPEGALAENVQML